MRVERESRSGGRGALGAYGQGLLNSSLVSNHRAAGGPDAAVFRKEFHDRLRVRVREELGRDAEPTAAVIDSQSVKADAVAGADSRGFDGGKLVNGRKRHVVVDTLGLLLGVMVTAAGTGDRIAAQVLLRQVTDVHHRLELVWADGGYTGKIGRA